MVDDLDFVLETVVFEVELGYFLILVGDGGALVRMTSAFGSLGRLFF